MRYRTLGRTGIQVSPYALGAMMFGAMGNPDHDDSIRIIHQALVAGINLIDTADVYAFAGRRSTPPFGTERPVSRTGAASFLRRPIPT